MHVIHARKVGERPWGWRDALVTAVSHDGWLTADYASAPGSVTAWHHADLTGDLHVGDPVRVHEQYWALGAPFGWLNIYIASGIGPVPTPKSPGQWADQVTGGVVNLGTGRGVALDHTEATPER